ncbi:MAG: NAD(P)(+) transhydrogenase (Re/Si-specific) subunit beta [Phycisphaeraceae bacterium]
MPSWLIDLAYLIASVMFIYGIKGMTHPRTARRGNLISAAAMLIAIVVTVLMKDTLTGGLIVTGVTGWSVVIAGLVVGSVIGVIWAKVVPMTSMPQMVAIFNGFGGLASLLVAWAEIFEANHIHARAFDAIAAAPGVDPATLQPVQQAVARGMALAQSAGGIWSLTPGIQELVSIGLAGLIGAVTFTGSLVAYAKLQEIKAFKKPWALPLHKAFNALLTFVCVGLCAAIVIMPEYGAWFYLPLAICAAVLGVTLTCPIGGADMPVVISLLNSYSGMAGCATGFVLNNNMLIIAGALVGASGIILTAIMCKAMNRSLANVIFGKIDVSTAANADDIYAGKIKSVSPDEIAMLLDGVQRVVIVPGYGMAVAQAQHATRDLYNILQERGVNVEFAIHPVAGRMPGHMNVLLAEVDIPYDKLVEMDAINPQMSQIDVAIVLGANDVVNPDARNENSAIAGMPIIDVDKARTVVVIKRSLSPGFAGIPNPLFALDNTLMYFADGKKAVMDLVTAIKELG